MMLFLFGSLYIALVLLGQLWFKKASNGLPTDSLIDFATHLATNRYLWAAMIIYFIAMGLWVWLLKQVDLSRLFPIMSALLLLTIPLVSSYFLHESLSLRYWLGVLLIIGGITLLATEIRT